MEKNSTLKNWQQINNPKIIYSIIFSVLFSLSTFSALFAQGHWDVEVSSDGSAPISRHENAYVECNGKFYLLGGRTLGVPKSVNIYDPVTKKWSTGAQSDIELHHFQAVCYNNLIYVIGALTGNYPNETPVDKIYIYNPSTNTWSHGPTIPANRRRGSAGVVVYNNKFYIVGGNTNGHNGGYVDWFDMYDPNPTTNPTGSWTTLTNAPHPRDHFHAVVIDDKLFLTGGRLSSSAPVLVSEVDVYNLTSQTWDYTYSNNIPTARAGASSVAYGDEVVVIGGEGSTLAGSLAHHHVEALDVNTKTWRSLASLNTGRHGTQALVYNSKIYITAGSGQKGGSTATQLTSTEVFTGTIIQGIQKTEEMNASCYPNPFDDRVLLSLDEKNAYSYKVTIYNVQGESLKELSMTAPSDIEIMMSEFTEGIYFLTIHNSDKNVQQSIKIVKK